MKVDVTAEQFRQVLTSVEPSLYEDWGLKSISITDDYTEIELTVSGYPNSSYLDFTPIFQLLSDANDKFGDRLWLYQVQFDARSVTGTVTLTTKQPTPDSQGDSTRSCQIAPAELVDVDYDSPPLIVGYCNPAKLSIE